MVKGECICDGFVQGQRRVYMWWFCTGQRTVYMWWCCTGSKDSVCVVVFYRVKGRCICGGIVQGQRTVYRLTLVKQWNTDELENYASLVTKGNPDFIEVKVRQPY